MKITDIAKLAGVSPATVSRIINKSGYASKESERKVLRVIKETNYTPNSIGRNLRKANTRTLLALFPDLSNSLFSDIIDGMEKKASEYGYGLVVAQASGKETEARYLAMLTSHSVDGYIPYINYCGAKRMNEICRHFPVVQAGEADDAIHSSIVGGNTREAAREAVRFLLRKGRRRIAFIYNRNAVFSSPLRQAGYRQALEEWDVPYDPALSIEGERSHADAYRACVRAMALSSPPTAYFCTSDDMATGVIRALVDRGLRVGEDADVIGCDNTSLAENYLPSITSIAGPSTDIGASAVELLMEKINDPDSVIKKIIMPYRLVVRQSAHE